ncbi:unnamed protein product [Phaedon cochleariae]|uniref:Succinate dehydrogenase assembly factor 3 n=1 Tax=Phaedon cochleariae TaxID=80249 RepID=A0A9P0DC25_PHACE|nr:unnamed protein product [Phaedon cochleariae]
MNYTNVQRVRVLYKTILKLHRGLPQELQLLGTNYVRDEFKRHKTCGENEARIFMSEWSNYALTLAEQLGLRGPSTGTDKLGAPLSPTELENFRDEQIYQLHDLMVEAAKPRKEE